MATKSYNLPEDEINLSFPVTPREMPSIGLKGDIRTPKTSLERALDYGGTPFAQIYGEFPTSKGVDGLPAGLQTIDDVVEVKQSVNSDGSTTFYATFEGEDGNGPVEITLCWRTKYPC